MSQIRLGGFLRSSTIDYPGKMGPVVYTQGCNFKCSYCHNPDLVHGGCDEDLLDPEIVFDYLKKMGKLVDVITITGGEPTMQGQKLVDFCAELKNRFKVKIKLDTNGTSTAVLKDLVHFNYIDYLAIDFKATWDRYHCLMKNFHQNHLHNIRETVGHVIEEWNIDYEFRTTMVFPYIDVKMDAEEYANALSGAKKVYLQVPRITNDDAGRGVLDPSAFKNPGGHAFAWDHDNIQDFANEITRCGRGIKYVHIR